ncbi:MAG: HAMP domain-containing sensor histidine kinase [Ekhidna sp.]
MNLIVRITVLFVLVSLVVFLIGGVISYNILLGEVNIEQERFLSERLDRMQIRLERKPPDDTLKWTKMMVIPLDSFQQERQSFSDTLVMHSQLERLEPHLLLNAIRNINGKSYEISLYDIIVEADDVRDGLIESLVTMYLILLAAVLIIGFLASYYVLRPFNDTLAVIKSFSLTKPDQELNFPNSRVVEFRRLNDFLMDMTNKVKSDYQSLKEFSENASHEIQTPIAIVQSKLEVLMDGDNLTEEQIQQLSFAQNTIKRLSHLGNALSLITKIDNREFADEATIDLSVTLEQMLEEFKELIELKGIKKVEEVTQGVLVQADRVLIELLLTNLINNAIRHNWEGGELQISLKSDQLKIVNTGPQLEIPTRELFRRFKKSNQSAKSMGLGLAIVKKICDLYDYELCYENLDESHTIHVLF